MGRRCGGERRAGVAGAGGAGADGARRLACRRRKRQQRLLGATLHRLRRFDLEGEGLILGAGAFDVAAGQRLGGDQFARERASIAALVDQRLRPIFSMSARSAVSALA